MREKKEKIKKREEEFCSKQGKLLKDTQELRLPECLCCNCVPTPEEEVFRFRKSIIKTSPQPTRTDCKKL